jgi:hypothetical protein
VNCYNQKNGNKIQKTEGRFLEGHRPEVGRFFLGSFQIKREGGIMFTINIVPLNEKLSCELQGCPFFGSGCTQKSKKTCGHYPYLRGLIEKKKYMLGGKCLFCGYGSHAVSCPFRFSSR